MLQQARRQRQDAALHFDRGHIFGLEFLGRVVIRAPGIDLGPTGKDIQRSKVIFGPGMNGQMRFGDHNDTGNPMRVECMKHNVDDTRLGHLRGLDHNGFHFMHIVQDFGVAVVEFDQEVTAE